MGGRDIPSSGRGGSEPSPDLPTSQSEEELLLEPSFFEPLSPDLDEPDDPPLDSLLEPLLSDLPAPDESPVEPLSPD